MSKTIKKETIHAAGIDIGIYTTDFKNEFISLTDIAKYKSIQPSVTIHNWLRGRDVVEFLGLWEKLHIKPGSVSILNVIGAPDTDVTFVLDKELVGAGFVSFHPNDNTASIAFDEKNIQKIMDEYNKTLLFMEVEG